MLTNDNNDLWSDFLRSLEILEEYGSCREKEESRSFLGRMGGLPHPRTVGECRRGIIRGKPMAFDD